MRRRRREETGGAGFGEAVEVEDECEDEGREPDSAGDDGEGCTDPKEG